MTHDLYIAWFDELTIDDIPRVGGKNASLGELTVNLGELGVRVPPGFATTVDAYWSYLEHNELRSLIETTLGDFSNGRASLASTGQAIRNAFLHGEWPYDIANAIISSYQELCDRLHRPHADVAVRSSATAEDLPEASFAGQQESYLNVRGEDNVLNACRACFASLFTDRAISYRIAKGFDHMQVALSVGIQSMVRADSGSAGVMFSIDTESGFDKVVLINAAWGLGENVVKGAVDPDEYQVFKPLLKYSSLSPVVEKKCGAKSIKMIYTEDEKATTENVPTSRAQRTAFVLNNDEILTLSRWACAIEDHYGKPMDMEWAKDGENQQLFIVQARPETVQSGRGIELMKTYHINRKGALLLSGHGIGEAMAIGKVCILENTQDIGKFVDGSILVTVMTDPDWVPIMKRAAAIITDHGGRTSHAAIISRELGLPAIVGTGDATRKLRTGQWVTVSCAEGDEGFVYDGKAEYDSEDIDVTSIPQTLTRVMLNLANPASAYRWWQLPADGIGLARMEFVISNHIKIHPMALAHFEQIRDVWVKQTITDLISGYADKREYFIDRLSLALARIAASRYPLPVIVRMSDFKTNEYANLIGGEEFEPNEDNPMIGFRGASRYYSPRYRDGFSLECQAIRRLREVIGMDNVIIMIPFCRTLEEADRVLDVMAENGLKRGVAGLKIYIMCEVPSNVILADAFAQRFDGFSIGSNDLTQLTLGVDRDSGELSELFDEQNDAVKWMIQRVITEAHRADTYVGLCGQAPSDHPEFASFLVSCGIDSISVTPDSFIAVKRRIAEAEEAANQAH